MSVYQSFIDSWPLSDDEYKLIRSDIYAFGPLTRETLCKVHDGDDLSLFDYCCWMMCAHHGYEHLGLPGRLSMEVRQTLLRYGIVCCAWRESHVYQRGESEVTDDDRAMVAHFDEMRDFPDRDFVVFPPIGSLSGGGVVTWPLREYSPVTWR